jgi:2-dehydro-3-deoxyglucarate aldolase/4-hydroxy-2-oxoheptanedioate aldolase
MFEAIEHFRQKLNNGRFCLGAAITFSDPAVSEALAPSVDFLWIDLEHNPVTLESLLGHFLSARAVGVPALVRVPGSDVAFIKRVLDTGADGVIVPQVRSAAEVQQVVAACRYPPMGERGYGPRRPSDYGRNAGVDFAEKANQLLFVAVQIETVEAYEELDDILAIAGLDSIVVGPQDLSGSMGLLGQVDHPRVREAITTTITKARRAGRYVGMGLGPSAERAIDAACLGVQWLQCGGDFTYMIDGVDQLFAHIRQAK